MRALPCLLVLAAVACGDDGASTAIDAAVDTSVQPDAPSGCDYSEQRDATNDDTASPAGTPEQTGLTLGARSVVCGSFAADHFDGDITVDVDGYVVTAAADIDVLVRIRGTGASAVELIGVDVYGGATLSTLVGSVTFYGDHGVTAVRLPAGTYELLPFALNSTALLAPVAYTLEVVADAPATRCPSLATGGYAEAGDGATNTGNDMVTIPSGMPPALTPLATDEPEPTAITLDAGASARVAGASADIATPDQYEDKDTFAFTTGATTNELTVDLTWPGTAANLDFLLFEANTADPITRAIATTLQGPERKTYSVKPATAYWLLVGTKAGATGFPITYGATLCGAAAAP